MTVPFVRINIGWSLTYQSENYPKRFAPKIINGQPCIMHCITCVPMHMHTVLYGIFNFARGWSSRPKWPFKRNLIVHKSEETSWTDHTLIAWKPNYFHFIKIGMKRKIPLTFGQKRTAHYCFDLWLISYKSQVSIVKMQSKSWSGTWHFSKGSTIRPRCISIPTKYCYSALKGHFNYSKGCQNFATRALPNKWCPSRNVLSTTKRDIWHSYRLIVWLSRIVLRPKICFSFETTTSVIDTLVSHYHILWIAG